MSCVCVPGLSKSLRPRPGVGLVPAFLVDVTGLANRAAGALSYIHALPARERILVVPYNINCVCDRPCVCVCEFAYVCDRNCMCVYM